MKKAAEDASASGRKAARPRRAGARSLNAFLREVRAAAEFTQGVSAEMGRLPGGLDTEAVVRAAQAVFEADMARRGDLQSHIALRKLRQSDRAQENSARRTQLAEEHRDRVLGFARERYEFSAARAVLKHLGTLQIIGANPEIGQTAKIALVRRKLFGQRPPTGVTVVEKVGVVTAAEGNDE